jgi:hypothetical protein
MIRLYNESNATTEMTWRQPAKSQAVVFHLTNRFSVGLLLSGPLFFLGAAA